MQLARFILDGVEIPVRSGNVGVTSSGLKPRWAVSLEAADWESAIPLLRAAQDAAAPVEAVMHGPDGSVCRGRVLVRRRPSVPTPGAVAVLEGGGPLSFENS